MCVGNISYSREVTGRMREKNEGWGRSTKGNCDKTTKLEDIPLAFPTFVVKQEQ
jgi:hypothetical protein